MEDDDDKWSYSLPSSTELLPSVEPDSESVEIKRLPADTSSDSGTNSSISSLGVVYEPLGNLESDRNSSQIAKHGSLDNLPSEFPNQVSVNTFVSKTTSSNGKQTSLVLQPAFMSKSAPADPQTTRQDANSVMSKENASNALASASDGPMGSPPLTPASKNDFSDSLKIWQQKTTDDDSLQQSSDMGSEIDAPHVTSPKIIAYRRGAHARKASNSLNLLEQEQKYDPKLYVSEKYKDSKYRYATMKRNVDFHQLFKSIDLTDRLLDDFACAISREILLQGRIFVTEHSICFNSNLLGWVTSLVLPLNEITRIDKKSTAGLFPNGITIETKASKHNFASFLSRDYVFEFMRTVWSASTGKDVAELDSNPLETSDSSGNSEKRISSYIMSIDEGDKVDDQWDDSHMEDSSGDRASTDNGIDGTPSLAPSVFKIKAMRPDSDYHNPGPDAHAPTVVPSEFEKPDEENEVASESFEAPLGAVFEILFGNKNTAFHKMILTDQGATEITEYGEFLASEDNALQQERVYTYQRPLGYSIGPKATKCIVREVVEYMDFAKAVVVSVTTDTPDVPSGGSFSVITRFYFSWGEMNTTNLRIAYFIKWTGRSWIKNVVEKSTLSAQKSVSKKTMEFLSEEIEKQTHYVDRSADGFNSSPSKTPALKQTENKSSVLQANKAPTLASSAFSSSKFSGSSTVLIGILFLFALLLMLYLQIRMMGAIVATTELLRKQMELIGSLLEITVKDKDSSWWEKISSDGKSDEKKEQLLLLAKQALLLLEENHEKSLKETIEKIF